MNGGIDSSGTLLASRLADDSDFADILAELEKSVEKELARDTTGLKLSDICVR